MPVYQNGKREGGASVFQPSASAQNVNGMQELLAQIAALTKGMAAAQGVQSGGAVDVDPAEALQRLADAGASIHDGKVVEGGIGDTDVVKGDAKSRRTLDLLNDL